MTKAVRIENADTSNYKIRVVVQQLSENSTWGTIHEYILHNPTDMITETIWGGKRLIIEEV
mgnify:CR=1 FL=1